MGVKRLINCPACKFANRYGDPQCVICKAPLPRAPGQPAGQAPAGGALPAGPKGPSRPGPPAAKPPVGAAPIGAGRKGPPPAAVGLRPPQTQPQPAPVNVRETVPVKRADLPVDDTVQDEGKSPDEATAPEKAGKATPTTRIVAGSVDRAKIVGWLCCDPLPPIPLGGKPVLTVGRHHDCDLVLPHKEVSRRHAVVKVRATAIVLEDEGSSNGCFVNGTRVSNAVLKVGDVITIGPYEVEIKSNEMMLEKDERSDTKHNLNTSSQRLSPEAGMTGKLQDMPLAEVLQGIEFNKKTGTLVVTVDRSQQGMLVVVNGLPQLATWGDLRGDEAVLRMLGLFKGRFTFTTTAEPCERAMKTTITALLLEASRRIDEGDTAQADQGAPPVRAAEESPDEEEDGGDFNFG